MAPVWDAYQVPPCAWSSVRYWGTEMSTAQSSSPGVTVRQRGGNAQRWSKRQKKANQEEGAGKAIASPRIKSP